ncbi:hypothetical protein SUDANB145_07307 (plasmid) [Streptomyces sp. enrichment culture]|uniref:hypothetical protein n=1 Tax=Streptomyces sp. enrichment culture TaxID=1795815 RepID=UPI003F55377C
MPFSVPVLVVLVALVLVVSAVGTAVVLRWERRRPSYRQRWEAEMAEWRRLPTWVQAGYDQAALDAQEAAGHEAARTHSLYRF